MKRRNAMLGLAAGPLALTSASFAQNAGGGNGAAGTNLRGLLVNSGSVVGTFDIKRFVATSTGLQAIGTLTASDGTKTAVATEKVPVVASTIAQAHAISAAADPSCPILSLTLGPLNLDVLGLVISIPNTIVINITAVSGAGNLLGNLLCTIAGLLDSGSPLSSILQQLTNLLNQLLSQL